MPNELPAVVFVGGFVIKPSFTAPVAATLLNAVLVADVRPVEAAPSVQFETCVAILRLLYVATPAAVVAVVVPPSVAAQPPSEIVTLT